MPVFNFKNLFKKISSVGVSPADTKETITAKNLLVFLAILMSFGGVLWGGILLFFKMPLPSIIPFGYVVISIVNISIFRKYRNFDSARYLQIIFSMLLPFMLQWSLGGSLGSGVIMLWSSLALIGSITLLKGENAYRWLALFIGLVLFSLWLEPRIAGLRPAQFTTEVANALLTINMLTIITIVFILAKVKVDQDLLIKKELSEAVNNLQALNRDNIEKNHALNYANENLKKVNSELDAFVYRVSHDLRSPISSAKGLHTIIDNSQTEGEKAIYHQLLGESLERIDSFIKDILNLSRNSRTELKVSKIDFSSLIEEVFAQHSFDQDALKVQKDFSVGLEEVFYTDPTRLKVILNNLVANAIRYHNPYIEQPMLSVNVLPCKEGMHLIVSDNGLGINKEHQKRIFEMFFRGNTQKTGSGLGLYIVKEAVGKLGGTLALKSEVNKGTQFDIMLPSLGKAPVNEPNANTEKDKGLFVGNSQAKVSPV